MVLVVEVYFGLQGQERSLWDDIYARMWIIECHAKNEIKYSKKKGEHV